MRTVTLNDAQQHLLELVRDFPREGELPISDASRSVARLHTVLPQTSLRQLSLIFCLLMFAGTQVHAQDPIPGTLRWFFATGVNLVSSPAIGVDGTIYVGSWWGDLYALDGVTGVEKWSYKAGSYVDSSPAIGADGTVYVGSSDNNVYALDGATGFKRWSFKTGSPIHSSPAIGADGTVYVGSDDMRIYALNGTTGAKKWAFTTAGIVRSAVAIGTDGTVYVGSADGKIYALDGATGLKKWSFKTGSRIHSSPAIAADGTVYIGSDDKRIYAIDGVTGANKWSFETGDWVTSSPAIGVDGMVYVGSWDKSVYALDGVMGTKKWSFATGAAVESSPAIGADGTVYVGSRDNSIYALDGVTGSQKWSFATSGWVSSSPVIGADGTVYVGSKDGKLYALFGSSPLENGPWPMLGRNTRHQRSAQYQGTPRVVVEPSGGAAPLRGPFMLGVMAGGAWPLSYQWRKDGVDLIQSARVNGVGTSVLRLLDVKVEDAGAYSVVVRNTEGSVTSVVVQVTTRTPMMGEKKWSFETGDWVTSSPAIGVDGMVYVGSWDKSVYALDGVMGTKKWSFATGGPISSSPALGADGTVYVGSNDKRVYALDALTGRKKWSLDTGGPVTSSPAIGTDGTVYLGAFYGLHALDGVTGTRKWYFATRDSISFRSPAVGTNGMVYAGCGRNGYIYALDAVTGAAKWSFVTGGLVESCSAVGPDGAILVGVSDFGFYVLDGATGVKKLHIPYDSAAEVSPAVAADGTIYLGSYFSNFYSLDGSTGLKQWSFATSGHIASSPAIAADGTLYAGSDDGKLYALDSSDGTKKWSFSTDDAVQSSAAIGNDGTVYVGSNDRNVYALFGSSPAAEAGWPMFRHDGKRTGRTPVASPTIDAQPRDFLALPGTEAHFMVSATGKAPLRYQWRFHGLPLAGATNSDYVIASVTAADWGVYDVVVSNDFGSAASSGAALSERLPNQAPVFVKGPDQFAGKNAGAQIVTGWATGISAGGVSETNQALTFLVSNDHNELFSVQPEVSNDGTLSYIPAEAVTGTVIVTVVLKDDGGTGSGGVDTSPAQYFSITISDPRPPMISGIAWKQGAEGYLEIRWDGSSVLQRADTPMGEWQDIAGALSPCVIRADKAGEFFRLRASQ